MYYLKKVRRIFIMALFCPEGNDCRELQLLTKVVETLRQTEKYAVQSISFSLLLKENENMIA